MSARFRSLQSPGELTSFVLSISTRPVQLTPTKVVARFDAPRAPAKTRATTIENQPQEDYVSTLEGPYNYVPRAPVARTDSSSSNPFHPQSKVALRDEARLAAINAKLPPPSLTPSLDLPLPDHYKALQDLHDAVETSLVAYFATTTNFGAVETTEEEGAKRISLPRVITYSALQQLVQQCRQHRRARNLGRTQFAQLAWLWSGGKAEMQGAKQQDAGDAESTAKSEIRGLGFIVRKAKVPDVRTGKLVWDWAIGIELSLRRPVRDETPPLQMSFPVAGPRPATPTMSSSAAFSSSPSTPKRRRFNSSSDWTPPETLHNTSGRDQMSISTMWQSAVESRKQEVALRLRERAVQHYEAFSRDASQEGHDVGLPVPSAETSHKTPPTTPRKGSHAAVIGAGGLLTPSATRSPDHQLGRGRYAKLGVPSPVLEAWPEEFDLKHLPAIPQAVLPSLKDASGIKVPSLKLAEVTKEVAPAPSAAPSGPTDASLQGRSMSLQERIRAKEAQAHAKVGPAGIARGAGSKAVMQRHRDNSILSRLPMAAEALVSLFSSASMAGAGIRYRKKSAREVMSAVRKVLPSGTDEDAKNALDMIRRLAPSFLATEMVQGQGEYYKRIAGKGAVTPAKLQQILKEEITRVGSQ